MLTMAEFLTDLRQSKIGTALLAERDAKARATRQAGVDTLAALRLELPVTADTHDRTIAPLQAVAEAAEVKFKAADAVLRRAQQARAAAVHTIESRIVRLERDLSASADGRVDAARHAMRQKFDRERGALARSEEILTGLFDTRTGGPEKRAVANLQAIARLLDRMRDADVGFDQLKLGNPPDLEIAIAKVLEPVETAWSTVADLDVDGGPKA